METQSTEGRESTPHLVMFEPEASGNHLQQILLRFARAQPESDGQPSG
jgi:hypothetical protein